jgi:hypothetical protein
MAAASADGGYQVGTHGIVETTDGTVGTTDGIKLYGMMFIQC